MKNRILIYREKTFLIFIELSILLFLLVSSNSVAEILTIEEGDTLYLMDLIESGEYRKYMGEIDFEGCNIEGDTLFIGEERGDYGFSIGSLSVGLNDDRLISYEISGQFLIPSSKDAKFYFYIHRDSLGRPDVYSRCVMEVELFEELVLYDMYDDRIQMEYWEELGKSEKEVIPDIWYDFDIRVKGSYVAVYIDDIPWVFTDVLSSRRGGFEISVSNLEESDFSIAFKDLIVNFSRLD